MKISKDVKTFARSFIVVLAALFIADWLIGDALAFLYKRQTSGALYRSTFALDSTNAEFLVFGSSRASHHYDSRVLEQRLKSTVYNCGRDGMGVVYSAAMISAITARYKPKCVIIDIREYEFTVTDEGKISTLFPYYHNKFIKPYYSYNGPLESLKFVSHIYAYNSILINLLLGVTSYQKNDANEYNGYLPINGSSPKKYKRLTESNNVDKAKIKCFKDLINKLERQHIPTFIVISPAYSYNIDGATVNVLKELSKGLTSVKFLNFTHSQMCNQPQYFFDVSHLNKEGAKVFSNDLAIHILKDI